MLMFVLNAWAGVPYQFQAGTPAKASEVNENFELLDKLLSSVEKGLKALPGRIAENSFWAIAHEPVVTTVGQQVTIAFHRARVPLRLPSEGVAVITHL